jgi:hypothetical protein
MAASMRTIEYVLIGLMAYQLVRLWWRQNRRRVKKWWQRVKDHHPRQLCRVWSKNLIYGEIWTYAASR